MLRSAPSEAARWLGPRTPDGATATVYCLPYAGSGARAFRALSRAAPPDVRVQPVHLPGREARISEPLALDAVPIAAALAERGDAPFALYGHSMGGRLAFEVVRELRRRRAPLPVRLYVGGSGAPHVPEPLGRLADLEDDAMLADLVALGGLPAGVAADHELRDLVLPVLRNDIRWVEEYVHEPEEPLPLPVVAVCGLRDTDVGHGQMLPWARHSSSWFRLHTLPGDHFFLESDARQLAALITADLRAALRGGDPQAGPLAPPSADEVHVWAAELDHLPELCSAWGELSPREALRAARFREDVHRRRHVGQCVLLRRLLARYGAPVGTAELARGPKGKPRLHGSGGIRFNVSGSDGFTLVAVTRDQEVGVDVERLRPMADLASFCDGALDERERAELAALPARERLDLALRIWTAKEAVLKATGDGLSVEPDAFGFDRRPSGRPWHPRAAPGLGRLLPWRVRHLPLEGAIGALALLDGPWRLRVETLAAGR